MALINSPPRYRCTCANGFANGVCGYPFIAEYAAECTVYTGGVCDVDVDECSSSPCANRCGNATKEMMRLLSNPTYMSSLWFRNCNPKPLRAHSGSCTDSTTAYRPPSCGGTDDGNGTACATNASSTGCVVDGGDCLFAGCTPGGCTVAGWNNTIPVDRFSCACAAGFADGICAYDYIAEYAAQCDVALGGRCQLDVDECVSAPCSNGAACLDSNATQVGSASLSKPTSQPTQPLKMRCHVGPDPPGRPAAVRPRDRARELLGLQQPGVLRQRRRHVGVERQAERERVRGDRNQRDGM